MSIKNPPGPELFYKNSVSACGENCARSLAPPLPTKFGDFAGPPSPCSPNGVPAPDSISGVISLVPSGGRSQWTIPFRRSFSCFGQRKKPVAYTTTPAGWPSPRWCSFWFVYITGFYCFNQYSLFSWRSLVGAL